MICPTTEQTNKQNETRTENQTCFRRSALKKKKSTQLVERVPYGAGMHWGVACITTGVDVYAVMVGSLSLKIR